MASLEQELAEVSSMTDLKALRGKRRARKGQFTRIATMMDDFAAQDSERINLKELQRRISELRKHITIFDAIQSKIEDLAAKEPTVLEEEIGHGLADQQEYELLLDRAEAEEERVLLHDEAQLISEKLTHLVEQEAPHLPVYQAEYAKLGDRILDFERKARRQRKHPEVKERVAEIKKLSTAYLAKLAAKESSLSPVKESVSPFTSEASPAPRRHGYRSNLTLDLPTFSGKPVDWQPFKKLFSAVIETAGEGMPATELHCHLLKAMKSDQAKRVVTNAAHSEDSYTQAMKDLEETFGRSSVVFPHYISQLLKGRKFSYDSSGLSQFRETFDAVNRGVKACKGATYEQLMGGFALHSFDDRMHDEWAHHYDEEDLPKLSDILDFFRKRHLAMKPKESSVTKTQQAYRPNKPSNEPRRTQALNRVESTNNFVTCKACNKDGHPVSRCRTFQSWKPEERQEAVRKWGYCFNCLSHLHQVRNCDSSFRCRTCDGRHHTLLHRATGQDTDTPTITPESEGVVLFSHAGNQGRTVMATAMFKARNQGLVQSARLFLDSGSSASLITDSLVTELDLYRTPQRQEFTTAAGKLVSKHVVHIDVHSAHEEEGPVVGVWCHVVPKIPSSNPPRDVELIKKNLLLKGKAPLADPALGGRVDLLLSITDSNRCIRGGPSYNKEQTASITPTIFGWVLGGSWPGSVNKQPVLNVQYSSDDLRQVLERIWQMDIVPESGNKLSSTDRKVVEKFKDTYRVDSQGRYAVELPWKDPPPTLGTSRPAAERRFLRHERKLETKEKQQEYQEAVLEYLLTDHAELVPKSDLAKPPSQTFYLPHRGVYKETSSTTKLRVVFDGSAKSSTGVSLNEAMETGPNLLPLLPSILTTFRFHQVALSADISKMFREILLQDQERDYHRFLARNRSGDIEDLRMKRLTFGIRASPYLATQVLHTHADTHSHSHPRAAKVVKNNFYVDDCLIGTSTVEEAQDLCQQLCSLLSLAGMTLRKWRSNCPAAISLVPQEMREASDLLLVDPTVSGKALGLHWAVKDDQFYVSTPDIPSDKVTKRLIASVTASVFDLLGFFSPVTLLPRLILQDLWRLKIDWDQEVPDLILDSWKQWITQLPLLRQHPINRRLIPLDQPVQSLQLHGFSDASSKAYGACIYLRAMYQDTSASVVLVTSKARVAPLKVVTIPKLELTAAVMLARMLHIVAGDLSITLTDVYAWTDSAVVLAWLQRNPCDLKVFEANRVQTIQELVPITQWRHVRTSDNPADLASRGSSTVELLRNSLWWSGPVWLKESPACWPLPLLPVSRDKEEVTVGLRGKVVLQVTPSQHDNSIFTRWSSWDRTATVVAWIRRFFQNSQKKRDERNHAPRITLEELQSAEDSLFKLIQTQHYAQVLEDLDKGKTISKAQPLHKYNLSRSHTGVLLISSRVRDTGQARPKTYIPLPGQSLGTRLYLDEQHRKLNHPGTSIMLAHLAERFHVFGAKRYLKKLIRTCVSCQKVLAQPTHQRMGLLPAVRTEEKPPFVSTGIDFAGPFSVRVGLPRSKVTSKAYLVLFICMYTKAVHLEICSSLSTEAFLTTLRNFCNRRGTPQDIYTDNGSNFVGAKREIRELQDFLSKSTTQDSISRLALEKRFKWHFIPPRAPHTGGLWEAGVKAAKRLLLQLLGNRTITTEQLTTMAIEAEAIMNSRPLVEPHSTDPDGEPAITPGHALIGRSLSNPIPLSTDTASRPDQLRGWNFINRARHDLWRKWSSRYLQSLSARKKWHKKTRNFQAGDIVIVKDELLQSLNRMWPMGLIVDTYSGADGLVRTVQFRCQGKLYKRATNRLVLLIPAKMTSSSSSPPEDVGAHAPNNSTALLPPNGQQHCTTAAVAEGSRASRR